MKRFRTIEITEQRRGHISKGAKEWLAVSNSPADGLTPAVPDVSTSSAVSKEQQTERMGLRLTPSEVTMLEALSEATGLTMSNVVRQAIRREYSERFGELVPPKAKKTKR